jgi:carboxypeptidase T
MSPRRLAGVFGGLLWVVSTASAQFTPIDFSHFHTPAQVDAELTNLQLRFPGFALVSTIGTSLEGRPIKAIKISDNVAHDDLDEGDVVFVALHHAREWISTEMALYLAEQILTRRAADPQLRADVGNLQIWIIPVVNPDGYAYTASATGDRNWRKNRRDNLDGTFGVDVNRNWGYQWGLASGSSSMTSYDNYHGTGAFSEPETQAIRDFVNSRHNLKAFVSYHSFSELFLRPWFYSTSDPPGEGSLKSIVDRSIAAIAAVHGHTYSPDIWYTASGDAADYLWGEKRIAAFTPELRPSGPVTLAGFSPPPSEIVPTGEENLPAALALIHDAGGREVWVRDYLGDSGEEPSAVWTGSGWSHAFWESPDIWTVPTTLIEGQTVQLNVHVNNNTTGTMNDVVVEAYWTDPTISTEFPSLTATLIGRQTISVPATGTTISMPWVVPIGANSWGERHWCVGVVVKHDRDLPLTTLPERSSNIALKNFATISFRIRRTLLVAARNFLSVDAEARVVIDTATLPPGWHVTVAPIFPDSGAARTGIERKARLLGATGRLLRPGESVLIPVIVDPPPDVEPGATVDIRIQGGLMPLVAGPRPVLGNGYTYRVVADSGAVPR